MQLVVLALLGLVGRRPLRGCRDHLTPGRTGSLAMMPRARRSRSSGPLKSWPSECTVRITMQRSGSSWHGNGMVLSCMVCAWRMPIFVGSQNVFYGVKQPSQPCMIGQPCQTTPVRCAWTNCVLSTYTPCVHCQGCTFGLQLHPLVHPGHVIAQLPRWLPCFW